ncbi:MAG: branched chain amino acid aminotransferase [Halobacteriovoraceae bacterium]|nr:branched chain amino acid aminotransferase [Halobacteriovoraceae bacterium]
MNVESKYVWHQGKIIPFEEAKIHVLNTSLHYGLSVFEGIRSYQTPKGPAIFRLLDHMKRLQDGLKLLGVETPPYGLKKTMESCKQVLKANHLKEAYIRPIFYIKEGGWGLSLKDTSWDYSVAAWPWDSYHGEKAKKEGIKAVISSLTRNHVNVSLTKGKISGHYVNSALAKAEAQRAGSQEAILLDHNGTVAECTGQNIFVVTKGKILTPPSHLILEGFTRETVIEILEEEGQSVSEMPLTRDQLYLADEVFIVGTANEVLPIIEIDGISIGNGKPGEICLMAQFFYDELVHGKRNPDSEYIDYIFNN